MNLDDVDWLGFDLDHTLVKYKNRALGEHIFQACSRYLCEKLGYRKEALEGVVYDPSFNIRGRVWDLASGDILELNHVGSVTAAWHGNRPLTKEEREERYAPNRPYKNFDKIKTFERGDFFCFNDFFVSPTVQLVACLVDDLEATTGSLPSGVETYQPILNVIFKAFDGNFCPEHFATDHGFYFPALKANISKYVFDRQHDNTRSWLETIRQPPFKKRIFLLTNSSFDYSELLLNGAFGENWRDLFDLVVYRGAKKYGFFDKDNSEKPFLRYTPGAGVDGPVLTTSISDYVGEGNKELISGNLTELTKFLGSEARVVYFGDDIVGDVYYSKTKSKWSAVGLAEELAHVTKSGGNTASTFTTCADSSETFLYSAFREIGDGVVADCQHFGASPSSSP